MKYHEITLDGVLYESSSPGRGITARSSQTRFRFDLFVAAVESLLKARRISRVLVHCKPGFRPQGYAGYEMIRKQLTRLASAGKDLWFYAEHYGLGELYLASACRHRVLHPLGFVQALGLSRPFVFFRKALTEHKLHVEVFRRGRYKGALDSFRNHRLDHFQREQYNDLLLGTMTEIQNRIAEGYNCSVRDLDILTSGTALGAREALDGNWATARMSYPELVGGWRDDKSRKSAVKTSETGFGRGRTVVVLFIEGTLVSGRSRNSPVFGQTAGSETVCEQLARLERNRRVKAVVVRINSGGGSASASGSILHAIERLRRKKPVVVSMGEIAASGGYWIATQAERLFVERSTITGSIGVLMAVFNLREFLKSKGVTEDIVKTHEHADLGSPLRRLTNKERQMLDEMISKLYYAFLRRVSEFRGRAIAEIERLAEGRVWSGYDAVRLGLADELGTLTDAIEYTRRIHTGTCRVRYYPREKRSLLHRLIARNLGAEGTEAAELGAETLWDECAALQGVPLALWEPMFEHSLAALANGLCNHVYRRYTPEAQKSCTV